METVRGEDLSLGDVVTTFATHMGYDTATVVKIDHGAGLVTLFRPYVHTGDFSYSGGKDAHTVQHYIGTETYQVWFTSTVTRLRKGAPLK